ERARERGPLGDPLGAGVLAGGERAGLRYREAVGGVRGIGELQRVRGPAAGHRRGDLVAGLQRGALYLHTGRDHLEPGEVDGRTLEALGIRAKLLDRFVVEAAQADPVRGDLVLAGTRQARRRPAPAYLGERLSLGGRVGVARPVVAASGGHAVDRVRAAWVQQDGLRMVVAQAVGQRRPGLSG